MTDSTFAPAGSVRPQSGDWEKTETWAVGRGRPADLARRQVQHVKCAVPCLPPRSRSVRGVASSGFGVGCRAASSGDQQKSEFPAGPARRCREVAACVSPCATPRSSAAPVLRTCRVVRKRRHRARGPGPSAEPPKR